MQTAAVPVGANASKRCLRLVVSDLKLWTAAPRVMEAVLSTQTVNGVSTDTVQADVVLPGAGQGFVRFRRMPSSSRTK